MSDDKPETTRDYKRRIGKEMAEIERLENAAPDLLEACKLAAQALEEMRETIDPFPREIRKWQEAEEACRAAIAKAEGE